MDKIYDLGRLKEQTPEICMARIQKLRNLLNLNLNRCKSDVAKKLLATNLGL